MKRNFAWFLACLWITACGGGVEDEQTEIEVAEDEIAAPNIKIGEEFTDNAPFS
jgi:hypothetical protein